ncbi:hypothetical protein FXF03_10760 [Vibrio cholerae]|uniref:Uncharacterized protein n=1 Tax=Vibrio cholerae TaxID=666 RepID=A0ABD7SJL5_VIBCL|nr:hypothetical protein FXF03_10760 [Vibrio cholerae]
MPCIIVGFYWLAKDICGVNKKSGGIFFEKNGGGLIQLLSRFQLVLLLIKILLMCVCHTKSYPNSVYAEIMHQEAL